MLKYPAVEINSPLNIALDRILEYYGNLTKVNEIIDKGDHWIVYIDVYPSELINDQRKNMNKRIFYIWEKLIELKIDKKNKKLVDPPSISTVEKKIREKKLDIARKAELIMINSSEEKFGKIIFSESQNSMINPLTTLLNFFLDNFKMEIDEFYARKNNFKKQGQVLFDEGFISKKASYIQRENIFTEKLKKLKENYESSSEIISSLLGYLFSKHYAYFTDICKIHLLNSYINCSLSYYIPSIYYGDPISLSIQDYKRFYKEYFYYIRRSIHFNRVLDILDENEIISIEGIRKNKTITGNEEIFDYLYKRKDDFLSNYQAPKLISAMGL